MPNVTHYEPYGALADVYTVAGYARTMEALGPRIMDLVFSLEWFGSSALDLGCGTGELACYLAEHGGLRVFAVDSSKEMIGMAQAGSAPKGLSIDWIHGDLRTFRPEIKVDLAVAVGGTLNQLSTLNDLETMVRQVSASLEKGKLFVCDLTTIRGLSESAGDRLVFDNGENVMIMTRSQFSFETLSLTTTYHILTHNGLEWRRAEEKHVQRGYPVQAVQRLLPKYGLKLLRMMNSAMETVDPADVSRVLFLAQKEG